MGNGYINIIKILGYHSFAFIYPCYIDVPEKVLLAEKTDEIGFSRELRMLAAVKLYELGRLPSGRAAELAGMTRVEFLLSLNRYHVFPLASELEDPEGTHAGPST